MWSVGAWERENVGVPSDRFLTLHAPTLPRSTASADGFARQRRPPGVEVVDGRVAGPDPIRRPQGLGEVLLRRAHRLLHREPAGEPGGDRGRESAAGPVRVRRVDPRPGADRDDAGAVVEEIDRVAGRVATLDDHVARPEVADAPRGLAAVA